jgi:hypothetical protein
MLQLWREAGILAFPLYVMIKWQYNNRKGY